MTYYPPYKCVVFDLNKVIEHAPLNIEVGVWPWQSQSDPSLGLLYGLFLLGLLGRVIDAIFLLPEKGYL